MRNLAESRKRNGADTFRSSRDIFGEEHNGIRNEECCDFGRGTAGGRAKRRKRSQMPIRGQHYCTKKP